MGIASCACDAIRPSSNRFEVERVYPLAGTFAGSGSIRRTKEDSG